METHEQIKNKISILTPSRSRPSRLNDFVKSVYEMSKAPENLEFLNYVDNDDPDIDSYKKIEKQITASSECKFLFKNFYESPMSVSKSWNVLASNSSGNVLIMGNDDVIYKTRGWDSILIEETLKFKDDIYLMWFNDGIKKNKHASFPIISRKWYETLGYFTPGCFNFGFNDTWLFEISLIIKRAHYLDNVLIDHMSWKSDKKYWDSTYARNRTQERGNLYNKDKEIWDKTYYERIKEAVKLIHLIENK